MALSHTRAKLGSKKRMPNGRVKASVSAGLRDDGTQRRLYATFDTDEEADAWIAATAAELGRDPGLARGITLAQWWEFYAATRGARLARSTYERRESLMRRVWLPELGATDVSLVTHRAVQAVLMAQPTRSQARECQKHLSAVLGWAAHEGVVSANPCAGAAFELPGDVGVVELDEAYDLDPFGAIEGTADVWSAPQALEAARRVRGIPLESCWLCMVGAGLRREEALALRWRDVRRVDVGGAPVVQVAVHHALTARDGRKQTKGTRSVRIVTVCEPFGSRLWELRREDADAVCPVSVNNISRRWKRMWEPQSGDARTPREPATHVLAGRMLDADGNPAVPFLPLKQMRHTHETFMQSVGVPDSLNAALHGHSQKVAYEHYMRPETADAAARVGGLFLVDGGSERPVANAANA